MCRSCTTNIYNVDSFLPICSIFQHPCPYVYFDDCLEGLPMRLYQRHDIATSSSIGHGGSFLKAARGNHEKPQPDNDTNGEECASRICVCMRVPALGACIHDSRIDLILFFSYRCMKAAVDMLLSMGWFHKSRPGPANATLSALPLAVLRAPLSHPVLSIRHCDLEATSANTRWENPTRRERGWQQRPVDRIASCRHLPASTWAD